MSGHVKSLLDTELRWCGKVLDKVVDELYQSLDDRDRATESKSSNNINSRILVQGILNFQAVGIVEYLQLVIKRLPKSCIGIVPIPPCDDPTQV
jgi:hypothetical protein